MELCSNTPKDEKPIAMATNRGAKLWFHWSLVCSLRTALEVSTVWQATTICLITRNTWTTSWRSCTELGSWPSYQRLLRKQNKNPVSWSWILIIEVYLIVSRWFQFHSSLKDHPIWFVHSAWHCSTKQGQWSRSSMPVASTFCANMSKWSSTVSPLWWNCVGEHCLVHERG